MIEAVFCLTFSWGKDILTTGMIRSVWKRNVCEKKKQSVESVFVGERIDT